ncbi:unnamed protein product, partial [Iphiclides podalirius]
MFSFTAEHMIRRSIIDNARPRRITNGCWPAGKKKKTSAHASESRPPPVLCRARAEQHATKPPADRNTRATKLQKFVHTYFIIVSERARVC